VNSDACKNSQPGLSRRRLLLSGGAFCLINGATLFSASLHASTARQVHIGGSAIDLPAAPARIVVLDAGVAADCFALGAPVVAADVRIPGSFANRKTGFPPLWNKYAVSAKTQPLPQSETFDLAAIKALEPDLIIAGGGCPGGIKSLSQVEEFKAIAPTVTLPSLSSDWRANLKLAAQITNRDDAVAGLVQVADKRQAEVKEELRTRIPQGSFDIIQANREGTQNVPYAVSPLTALGKLLKELGFDIEDTGAKIDGEASPAEPPTRVIPFHALKKTLTAPNLFIINSGSITMGILCCHPIYNLIPSIQTYHRWEIDEISIQPHYLSFMRLLDSLDRSFKNPPQV